MISYLSGTVLYTDDQKLCIDIQGVGYEVLCPTQFLATIAQGEDLSLYTSLVVREDSMTLYGFADQQQKKFFETLLSVSGIGPKMGLIILDSPLENFVQAIFNEDVNTLSNIPGVGKKTAGRMIIELQDKLKNIPVSQTVSTKSATQPTVGMDDIVMALE
ncbi:MAG: Holliday junction branch migration protein RuvA [Patescibacteria group bacterium]|nr:Holliday junction branch migration protein RuvA [Patescibacteria group bacterium]